MKKVFIIVGAVAVLLVGGFFALNSYIYQEKQGVNNIQQTDERYRATLSGEYICLPHKDTSIPHADECTAGIKTDTNEFYAIDFYLMSQTHEPLVVGQKISASGVVHPVQLLSSDHWQKYPIIGIFSVTDSLQVLE